MTTSISTIGVMAALMLTLTLPAVANPPTALQAAEVGGALQAGWRAGRQREPLRQGRRHKLGSN